jgi:hypothetical protein
MLTSNRKTVTKNGDDGIIQSPNTPTSAAQNSGRISSAAIAGIVIAVFAVGILLTFVAYLLWRRRRLARAKEQAANPPKAEYTGGMSYPRPWEAPGGGDDDTIVIAHPTPRRQKDGQYSSPPTRYDGASDAGQSASVEGTTFSSPFPPSYVAATTSNAGSR